MNDENCILPDPGGLRVSNVDGLTACQVQPQRDEWRPLKFLKNIFAGHIGIIPFNGVQIIAIALQPRAGGLSGLSWAFERC